MALLAYELQPSECDAVLFEGALGAWDHPDMHDRWKTIILGELVVRTISGDHANILSEPNVRSLATELAASIERRRAMFLPSNGGPG